MPEHIDRSEGRRLFGFDPAGYDYARPRYPQWIFDQLRERGALYKGAATLEIGAGSGLATRSLVDAGVRPLTIVEPDAHFAESLAAVTATCQADFSLIQESFEAADLVPDSFDLVVAATSFHWVDQTVGLQKIRQILNPKGTAAFMWNVFQVLNQQDPFHDATQDLLSSLAISPSGAPNDIPFALDRASREADMRAAGATNIQYLESRWTLVLNTNQVGRLYEGFSSIQRLDPAQRSTTLARLTSIADAEFGGRVERNVTSCLYLFDWR